ncbi:hypothetical protein FN976_22080 [Caenimonas sedimenti]|uniref:Uncharacterized protein n=1 Tax=Caenimonas sedimenti TaxID=2596921 RepID=A0A562ZKA0_9BURK|nr:hypothetical protein FN976_22080 [Caenimonas sedimenti]
MAQPQAVLERFISADCDTCWADPATPGAAANALALDWVLPGGRGDDAPLSAVASRDGLDRLAALRQPVPPASAAHTSLRKGAGARVRVAQGNAFNDYVGASIELKGGGRWDAWLLLVEELPASTEGSPVARNLVRNVFRPDWDRPDRGGRTGAGLAETRAMQIHQGAQPDRLRLVALVHDRSGRLAAATMTSCKP